MSLALAVTETVRDTQAAFGMVEVVHSVERCHFLALSGFLWLVALLLPYLHSTVGGMFVSDSGRRNTLWTRDSGG